MRFVMRLVSKFLEGNTRMEQLVDGSWTRIVSDLAEIWNPKGKNPAHWKVWGNLPVHSLEESIKIFPPLDVEKCLVRVEAPDDIKVEITRNPEDDSILLEFFSMLSGHSSSPATVNTDVLPKDNEELEPDFDEN